jgi:hypothetical protein
VGREKNRKEILEGDFSWIEVDFDDFGMTCTPAANFFVGGIFCASASIPGHDRFHATQFIKHRLRAPKTTAAKDRNR